MNTAELFSLKPVVSSRPRIYCLGSTNERVKDRRDHPALCFEVPEGAQILRMSGAQFYNRIYDKKLKPQSV
jgi:hypothetical protein